MMGPGYGYTTIGAFSWWGMALMMFFGALVLAGLVLLTVWAVKAGSSQGTSGGGWQSPGTTGARRSSRGRQAQVGVRGDHQGAVRGDHAPSAGSSMDERANGAPSTREGSAASRTADPTRAAGDSKSHANPRSPGTRTHRLHWHVLLTHFPIGTFAGAFLFMLLDVIADDACYSRAAYVSLLAGALVVLPTTFIGWTTWKRQYKGFKNTLFRVKIFTAFAMIPISIGLVAYQTLYPFDALDVMHSTAHLIYFVGVVLLMLGSIVEGYWGARLHHR